MNDVSALLTMYHDQGQITMKLIGFDAGVTLMGGHPFPICNAAHGTVDAAMQPTGSDMDVTKLVRQNAKISIMRFEDDATLITALASGQRDIMIWAPAQMNGINAKAPGKKMEPKFTIRSNG